MIIEICCGSVNAVEQARLGGAKRIELCSGLLEGGLTPSLGLILEAVESGIPQVNVLIRPRSGDFLYTEREIEQMIIDIKIAVSAGAEGIVIGALTAEGDVDMAACRRMIEASREAAVRSRREAPTVTFHRAFDVSREPFVALEQIIELGCDTLLTSGMASTATKGAGLIKELVARAGGRITILAGAGVNPSNVRELVGATGVKAIHSTARKPRPSKMKFRRPEVPMGIPGEEEYSPLTTSSEVVKALHKCFDNI